MDKVINDVEVIIGGVSDGNIIKKAKNFEINSIPYAGVDPIPFDVIREKGNSCF